MIRFNHFLMMSILLMTAVAGGIDYPYSTVESQKTGWPLTEQERAYITDKTEHDRRPGREANKHLPHPSDHGSSTPRGAKTTNLERAVTKWMTKISSVQCCLAAWALPSKLMCA